MKKPVKYLLHGAWILLLIAGVSLFLYLRAMEKQDVEHAKFYETGSSINGFLKSYTKALKASWKAGDPAVIMAFYADDYASPGRGDWAFDAGEAVGDVTHRNALAQNQRDYGNAELYQHFQTYFASIGKIDSLRHKIDLIEGVEFGETAVLTVKYVLLAYDPDGKRIEDRFFTRWHLRVDPSMEGHAWLVTRDELVHGVRVEGSGAAFEEADLVAAGVDFHHQRDPKLNKKKTKLAFGVIEHAAGGISAADFNQDDRPDLFYPDGVASKLYQNVTLEDGQLAFQDVTEQSGLSGLDQALTGLWADFDNDGDQDLYVTRYMTENHLYINNGDNVFEEKGAQYGLDLVAPSISATLLDYNGDGYTDIYLGCNGNAYEAFPRLPFYARNGQPNRLYRNEAGKGFTDVTEEAGVGDTGWSLAVASGDYNGDGHADIVVANDFGRKNLYRNNGDGTFSEIAREAGVLDFSGGMGVTFGDFNEDGKLDLYTSNIKSNQRWFGEDVTINQYIRNVSRSKWIWKDLGEYMALRDLIGDAWVDLGKQVGEGNSMFYNNGDETFDELKDCNANQAGWGWSVAAFDMDNDTDLDIYAANGWITAKPDTDL